MVGVHGNHHEVKPAAVQGDFDVERDLELERMGAEKGPCFAKGVVSFIDHAGDLLPEHARRSEDLEAEFISVPFEFQSGGGHFALGAACPEDGSRIAAPKDRDHRCKPRLRQ